MVCDELKKGFDELGLAVSATQLNAFEQYLLCLEKWNKTYNLTALSPHEWPTKHILDCAALAPFLKPSDTILDIGSGAGLPGVVLAVLLPNATITMMDKVGKKVRFLQQVIATLRLQNAVAIHARAEEHHRHYDVITARAVAKPEVIVSISEHLLTKNGCYQLMLGKEACKLDMPGWKNKLTAINVPNCHAHRQILMLKRENT